MKTHRSTHTYHCGCGAASAAVHATPLFRFFCHCTICQAYNRKPFADVAVFRRKDIELPSHNTMELCAHRAPPSIQRGHCLTCQGPVLERAAWIGLAMVPSLNFKDTGFLPEPSLHMFYHRRVADVDDNTPKYSDYWPSELAFFRAVFAARFRGNKNA